MIRTLLLLLISTSLNAQAILGYTISEVKRHHSDKYFEFSPGDNGVFMSTQFGCATFVYYIPNGSDVVDACLSYPETQGCTNAFVENYNSKYTVINDKKWLAYLDSGVTMEIELLWDDKGYWYFIYTYK